MEGSGFGGSFGLRPFKSFAGSGLRIQDSGSISSCLASRISDAFESCWAQDKGV